MTKNFKTSELDMLYGTTSVKMPIPGGKLPDIREILDISFKNQKEIDLVIISLDIDRLILSAEERNDETKPDFLYDDNWLNDAGYLWNKSILVHDCLGNLKRTLQKEPSMTFDEYSSFSFETGEKTVLEKYYRRDDIVEEKPFTAEDKELVSQNVMTNYATLIEQNPQTEFLFFVPPYSVVFWDDLFRNGDVERILSAEEEAIRILLQYDNVKVFCFNEKQEWICNLDNYSDSMHYTGDINSAILQDMHEEAYRIKKDDLTEHIEESRLFFKNYDYDIICGSQP
ncbi:MAG: hypothetical protein PUB13_09235 [Lachnospiraceae bacterium]|nr:hypothetical protein [Lachnospiraceae bacterium]